MNGMHQKTQEVDKNYNLVFPVLIKLNGMIIGINEGMKSRNMTQDWTTGDEQCIKGGSEMGLGEIMGEIKR